MARTEQNTTKKKSGIGLGRILIGILVILAVVVGGVLVAPQLLGPEVFSGIPGFPGANAQTAPATALVTSITAVTTVTSAGPVAASQSGAVAWKTSGMVAGVYVKPGDHVKPGDVLMGLDLLTAPQNVIQAQAELISAQKTLDDLLHPSELAIANARKNVATAQDRLDELVTPSELSIATARQTVARAQDTLDKAVKALGTTTSPDIKYYQDQLRRAQDALINAQQNTTLIDIGQLPVNLRNAQKQLETATNVYNDAKAAVKDCPNCEKVWAYDRMISWNDAVNLYNDAVNQVEQIQLQIDQNQRGTAQTVTTAQDNLDKAQRNLNWALSGPNTVTLSVNQAAVEVAQSSLTDAQDKLNKLLTGNDETDIEVAKAALADAQDKLNHLLNGADPNDLAVAQARVLATKATVQTITLTAPFEGEVLAVNYQPGDAVTAGQVGVTLANRALLRVDAQVDESDVGQIRVGNPVSLTLEALPDVILAGKVSWINGAGATVQGLVKYTVRIDVDGSDPRVLLGMTANVAIVTNTQVGALAVPLDAVQLDQTGEYVNRVKDGVVERVNVTSGQIDGDQVVVLGDLQTGDAVQIIPPTSTSSNPFGMP